MANRRPPHGEGQRRGPARRQSPAGPPRPAQSSSSKPRPKAKPRNAEADGGLDRLQKVLAHAGVGSRRACEELILQGRVTVDNQVVRELGTRVDPEKSKIALDGQRIQPERMVYFAVSKPKGYVSTNNDPSGRPRVVDLLPEIPQRVYTVGRLDEMSMGLILLTNDGELANKLAHPKFGVEKLYRAVVAGTPEREVLNKLTEGVWLAEGKVKAKRVKVVGKRGQATILEMVLAEGKNREVRRMLAKLGHKVMSLTRIAVGPITLKGLAPGEHRSLSRLEIELLQKVAAGIAVAPLRFSNARPTRTPTNRPRPGAGAGEGGPRSREGAEPRYGSDRPGPNAGPPRNRAGASNAGGSRRPGGPYAGGPARRPNGPGAPQDRRPRPARTPSGQPYQMDEMDDGPQKRVPVTRPRELPPSQRRAVAGSGPAPRPGSGPRPGTGPGPRPGPGTGSRPGPAQRPGGEGSQGRPPVPRPSGPPPSQRRPQPQSGPASKRPKPPIDEPPTRRIIGLDTGSGPRRPRPEGRRPMPKGRFPRASLGPRRPRPADDGDQ